MEGINFLDYLEVDLTLSILTCLDNPADLVRASAVSRSWYHFVIANRLSKQLCLRMFPQVANLGQIVGPVNGKTSVHVESSNPIEWRILKRDHKVYACLVLALTKSKDDPKDCIAFAIGASSTDRDPEESIVNTLFPVDRYRWGCSCWCSGGQSNPDVPETLMYKLSADVCVVTEIDIQPFQVYWEPGTPVYPAKSVRFRMGNLKAERKNETSSWHLPLHQPPEDAFLWSYTSPEFAMTQENRLQRFRLPEPVICVGGCLQIELLGRVQIEAIDGLFYIGVCYVRVLGRPLSPSFELQALNESGKLQVKCNPEGLRSFLKRLSHDTVEARQETPVEHIRQLEDLLQIHVGPGFPFPQYVDEEGW